MSLDCVHLGQANGRYAIDPAGCQGCNKTAAPLYGCSKRGETTWNKKVNGHTHCGKCSDYSPKATAAVGPFAEFGPGLIDPLPGPVKDRSNWCWHTQVKTTNAHLEALRQVARMDFGSPSWTDEFGIIYVGEDSSKGMYGTMCVAGMKMARRHGYDGPFEWWWNSGRGKIDPTMVEGLGDVRIRDVAAVRPTPRFQSGWPDKSMVLLHSAFRYCLRIDADAYAVGDLQPIISALVGGEIVFGYWEEGSTIVWKRCWPDGPGDIKPPQGGQLFIDRAEAWPLLCTSAWIDQHADYYYPSKAYAVPHLRHGLYAFGDQAAVHIAGRALQEAGRLPKLTSFGPPVNVANCQEYTYAGKKIIVHRVADKPGKDWVPQIGRVVAESQFAQCWEECKEHTRPKVKIVQASAGHPSGCPDGWHHRTHTNDLVMFHEVHTQNEYQIGDLLGGIVLERFPKLQVFAGVSEFPARVKCASLAWHTLEHALEKKSDPAKTEGDSTP
jgi:hypothetical protein